MPDSGASRTVVDYNSLREHGIVPQKLPEPVYITIANGDKILCKGSADLLVTYSGYTRPIDALVAPNVHEGMLISWHDQQKWNVIPLDYPAHHLPKNAPKVITAYVATQGKSE